MDGPKKIHGKDVEVRILPKNYSIICRETNGEDMAHGHGSKIRAIIKNLKT